MCTLFVNFRVKTSIMLKYCVLLFKLVFDIC